MSRFFDTKVQKISVNAGFSCPNRDGTIGTGGCIYCDNTSFTPGYCFEKSDVISQLEKGKLFFGRKYPEMKYLAYFQSYTNTMGGAEYLEKIWREALSVDGVVGIIIGTRPDCITPVVVELLQRLASETEVFVELGAESFHDRTLKLINRGHDSETTRRAVKMLSEAGIHCGLHLIMGLPGEDESDMLCTVDEVVKLPVESLKFHHLQVLKSTDLHKRIVSGEMKVHTFTAEEYLDLCLKIISRVPRSIAIERFLASSPPEMVVSPKWGLKNYEFTNRLLSRLSKSKFS